MKQIRKQKLNQDKTKEQVLNIKRVYSGRVVRVDECDVDFGNDKHARYELITFSSVTGVSILPILDEDTVILLKHFQLGLGERDYTIPTGGLAKGEDPYKRAQLELREETGFSAGKLTLMTRTHLLPGYIGGKPAYLFLAQDLTVSFRQGDEPFEIEVIRLPLKKVERMIQVGRIKDGRTCFAILYYLNFIKEPEGIRAIQPNQF